MPLSHFSRQIEGKMDLTHFMGSEVQKDFFKVTFIAGDEKIKRFVKATSKHHAKSIMETQLRADFPGKICKIRICLAH